MKSPTFYDLFILSSFFPDSHLFFVAPLRRPFSPLEQSETLGECGELAAESDNKFDSRNK